MVEGVERAKSLVGGPEGRRLTCLCGREFTGLENEAWGLLQEHVVEEASRDENLHGIGREKRVSLVSQVSDAMLVAEHWGDEESELRRLRRMLAWTTKQNHDTYHKTEHPQWRRCTRMTCVAASIALTGTEDVDTEVL